MSLPSPKQKKGSFSHCCSCQSTALQIQCCRLLWVFLTAQLFQSTETHKENEVQAAKWSPCQQIVWWAHGCCGSQSRGSASFTPCLREPALLLGQYFEPAQCITSCSCFSQNKPFSSSLHMACLGCWSTQAGGNVVLCLSSVHYGDTSCAASNACTRHLPRAHFQQDCQ